MPPWLGPAEDGTGYEERVWSFAAGQTGEELAIPFDADEVIEFADLEDLERIYRAMSDAPDGEG